MTSHTENLQAEISRHPSTRMLLDQVRIEMGLQHPRLTFFKTMRLVVNRPDLPEVTGTLMAHEGTFPSPSINLLHPDSVQALRGYQSVDWEHSRLRFNLLIAGPASGPLWLQGVEVEVPHLRLQLLTDGQVHGSWVETDEATPTPPERQLEILERLAVRHLHDRLHLYRKPLPDRLAFQVTDLLTGEVTHPPLTRNVRGILGGELTTRAKELI